MTRPNAHEDSTIQLTSLFSLLLSYLCAHATIYYFDVSMIFPFPILSGRSGVGAPTQALFLLSVFQLFFNKSKINMTI
jgi:hypothetical protein